MHTKTAFDKKNFVKNNHYQSFDESWFKIANSKKSKESQSIKPLLNIVKQDIDLKNFKFFWKNPIHYFFYNRLNIQLDFKQLNITENFTPNELDRYKIRLYMIKKMINNTDISNIFQYLTDIGLLSHDNFSFAFLEKQKKEITPLTKKIFLIKKSPIIHKNFKIKVHNQYLYGCLHNIYDIGLFRWKPKKLNLNDSISLWLEHLIYCFLGGKEKSTILGINNTEYHFYPIEKEKAYQYITQYVSGYMKGLQKPLLLTKSGSNWINTIYDKINKKIIENKKNKGYEKMLSTWHGNQYYIGEKNDPYIKKIIPVLSENYINDIYDTSKNWLMPILKNQIIKL